MKYEINGKIVETDRELNDQEIDEIAAQIGDTPAPQAESAVSTEPSALGTLKSAAMSAGKKLFPGALETAEPFSSVRQAPDLIARSRNFVLGKPNQPAETPMQMMANRPDLMATAASTMIPGVGLVPAVARIAATAGSTALNPETRSLSDSGLAAGVQAGIETAFPVAGAVTKFIGTKALAPIAQTLSNVDKKEVIKLAEKPMEILFAPTKKALSEKFDDVYRAFGFTEPEVRLIAKAESKSGGGSMQIWDDVMAKISAGQEPTTAELIAARRASSKLGYSTKEGMLGTQFKKDVQLIDDKLKEKAPEIATKYLGLLKEYSNMMTRSKFLQLLPQNKNGSINALRSLIAVGGAAINPLSLAAMSPVTTGLGTLAAVGANKALVGAANSPVARTGLQTIRQYLQGQIQNGPGSR